MSDNDTQQNPPSPCTNPPLLTSRDPSPLPHLHRRSASKSAVRLSISISPTPPPFIRRPPPAAPLDSNGEIADVFFGFDIPSDGSTKYPSSSASASSPKRNNGGNNNGNEASTLLPTAPSRNPTPKDYHRHGLRLQHVWSSEPRLNQRGLLGPNVVRASTGRMEERAYTRNDEPDRVFYKATEGYDSDGEELPMRAGEVVRERGEEEERKDDVNRGGEGDELEKEEYIYDYMADGDGSGSQGRRRNGIDITRSGNDDGAEAQGGEEEEEDSPHRRRTHIPTTTRGLNLSTGINRTLRNRTGASSSSSSAATASASSPAQHYKTPRPMTYGTIPTATTAASNNLNPAKATDPLISSGPAASNITLFGPFVPSPKRSSWRNCWEACVQGCHFNDDDGDALPPARVVE
ncbi:MAG: hypothetical protein Q9169_005506 [Polycauliona sp. 2 TL-2023]